MSVSCYFLEYMYNPCFVHSVSTCRGYTLDVYTLHMVLSPVWQHTYIFLTVYPCTFSDFIHIHSREKHRMAATSLSRYVIRERLECMSICRVKVSVRLCWTPCNAAKQVTTPPRSAWTQHKYCFALYNIKSIPTHVETLCTKQGLYIFVNMYYLWYKVTRHAHEKSP